MKIIATIEARMDSNRLPGKILKDVCGCPMLERLIERVRRSKWIQGIVVATTTAENDGETERVCRGIGVACFRGSSEDVLDRVLQAAQSHSADLIVELTGDCPLLDPVIIDQVIATYLNGQYDYVSNVVERTFPRGLDTHVFPLRVLEEVSRLTQDPVDREHVSLYIYEHPERFRLGNVEAQGACRRPGLRLTVDTQEDLALIRKIYEAFYPLKREFGLQDVVAFLDANPEIAALNQHIRQKKVR